MRGRSRILKTPFSLPSVCVGFVNPFRTAVPFSVQTTQNSSSLYPKRDCGSERVKPFLLPVDIQHNQCPCRFFNSKKNTSSVATILRHRCYFATRYQVCSKNKAAYGMPCHRTGYDRHDIDIPRKKEGKQRRKGPY